jgi:endonuclease III
MLSSQTKDEVTDAAIAKLREALGGSISVEGMINAKDGAISEAIAKVGFWRRKTQSVMHLRLVYIVMLFVQVLETDCATTSRRLFFRCAKDGR